MRSIAHVPVALALVGAFALIAPPPARADGALEPLVSTGAEPQAPWHVVGLPNQKKPLTRFSVAEVDGRRAIKVEADASYGNLVHPLAGLAAPAKLHWHWRVEQPLAATDLRDKHGDDTDIKVCVMFDEPMDDISFADRQILRIVRSRSAEPVPSAMLCYVWDTQLPAGTMLPSPFTNRLRYLVLQSGDAKLNRWVAEKRDVGADFVRAFGSETKGVPPIVGIAVGADADNTKGRSTAYVADLVLER